MTDSIGASGNRAEGLSRAYVHAVAATAGYTLAEQNDSHSPSATQSVK